MNISEKTIARITQSVLHTWLRGKYRVDRLLGWGGAASVFEAVHRNGHRVAIKLLHPGLANDAAVRSRFLREGYLANQVGHRGAVRVLDDDVLEDGTPFLVMELLEGKTLDARADEQRGKLPLELVCRAGHQLLHVLAAAHAKGIVHRDIKPQNLFWTSDGVLKVLDFGLARLRLPESSVLTRSGEVFGTPAFMAPEQAIGDMESVDAASDQWGAAAAMFTLLTGAFVHEARTPTEIIVFCATRPARSIRTVDPSIPVRIGNVIDRALRFHKGERWPSVRDFQRALALAFEAELGRSISARSSGAGSVFPPLHVPLGTRVSRVMVAGVTALAVGSLGILAVRAFRDHREALPLPAVEAPLPRQAARAPAPGTTDDPPQIEIVGRAPIEVTPAPPAVRPVDVPAAASAPPRPRAATTPAPPPRAASPRPAPSAAPDPWSSQ